MSSIISCNLDPFFFSHLQYFLFYQIIFFKWWPLLHPPPPDVCCTKWTTHNIGYVKCKNPFPAISVLFLSFFFTFYIQQMATQGVILSDRTVFQIGANRFLENFTYELFKLSEKRQTVRMRICSPHEVPVYKPGTTAFYHLIECNKYMHHNKKAPILFGISVMNRKKWNANLCTVRVLYQYRYLDC